MGFARKGASTFLKRRPFERLLSEMTFGQAVFILAVVLFALGCYATQIMVIVRSLCISFNLFVLFMALLALLEFLIYRKKCLLALKLALAQKKS